MSDLYETDQIVFRLKHNFSEFYSHFIGNLSTFLIFKRNSHQRYEK